MPKSKFYLSTYVHIGPLAYLENLYYRHDQNMALWKLENDDLRLIHYWEMERETGKKEHFRSFYNIEHFQATANRLLALYGLSLDDMEQVIGSPEISTCSKEEYGSYCDYPNLEYHSIAHLFSSLLSNTKLYRTEKIIALALDGGPDRTLDISQDKKYYCGAYSENGTIHDVFPISSPAPLWTAAYTMFGLKEGSLMALASACECEADMPPAPQFTIENMEDIKLNTAPLKKYMIELRDYVWELDLFDKQKMKRSFDERFSEEENRISVAMKEIIKFSIAMVKGSLDKILKQYHLNPEECCLSVSGGFALNCPINGYLMQQYRFKRFIAPPCVNDSGISMGYGLYYFWKMNPNVNFTLKHAFYGDEDINLPSILLKSDATNAIRSATAINYDQAVEDIINYPIVWFNGRAEIGPRALGNRSIIADPRKEETKDILNYIKQRQWWRPVAPVALLEYVDDWFEEAEESPFMLRTFKIKESKKHLIPSIAHLDNSARLQTVTLEENPQLYWLIKAFMKKTGIPLLCNTSLNDRGEPIINRIPEALRFTLKKKIPVAYINQIRLEMNPNVEYQHPDKNIRRFDFDLYFSKEEQEKLKTEYNPHNLSMDDLNLYCFSALKDELDITNKKHADLIRRLNAATQDKYYWEIEKK